MIELGKFQKLKVLRFVSIGAYLGTGEKDEEVLLPKKQVPEDVSLGEDIEVFIYRDSQDRLVATTRTPKLSVGEVAPLKVIEITDIGAFLDWGLEKDLLLPFKEQTVKVEEGNEYIVGLYVDKSDRLCATMDTYSVLSSDSPYKVGDMIEGMIYSIKKDVGIFVAVDGKYHGMIPISESMRLYSRGEWIKARVIHIDEEGKLRLSFRLNVVDQMDKDSYTILKEIEKQGGTLFLTDKSEPEAIKKHLSMSKKAFKRGVGRLLKDGKIEIEEDYIKLVK